MKQLVLVFVAVLARISDGQTINKELGSYQQFQCAATFPASYLLDWKRGDEIVLRYLSATDSITATSSNFTGRVSIVGQQKTLGITSLRITDAGEFYCSVNDIASVSGPVAYARQTLLVYTRPSVTLPYTQYVVDAGSDVTFTCTATSFPPSNVTWQHPDGTRESGDVLRLRNATSQNQGQYSCTGDNGFGSDVRYVNLVVREPTKPPTTGPEGQSDPTPTSDRPIKTQDPQSAGGTGGLTGGVIAAIVVVCVVLVLAAIMGVVILVMKSRRKQQPEKPVVTASPVKEKDVTDGWDLTSSRRPENVNGHHGNGNHGNGNAHIMRPAAEGKPADPYWHTEVPPRDSDPYYSSVRQPRPGDPYWTPSPPASQAGWSSPPQSPSADLDYVHMGLQHAPAGSRRPIVGMVYDA